MKIFVFRFGFKLSDSRTSVNMDEKFIVRAKNEEDARAKNEAEFIRAQKQEHTYDWEMRVVYEFEEKSLDEGILVA